MHIKKLTKIQTIKILAHDKRENLTYSNENIDISKSKENVIYQNKILDDVLNGVYIHGKNGKNADKINYTASVCVHYPKNCPISEKEFFDYMNYILSNKFGKDNVVLSVVHNDEKRSHLHFLFCPVVKSEKHSKKLCCKEVVNREMLQLFHEDIENELFELCGKKISLRNDEEIRNIPFVEDIDIYKKLKDLENKCIELENGIIERENKIKELNIKGRAMVEKYNSLVDKFDALKIEFDEMQQEIKRYLLDDMSLDEKIDFTKRYNIDEIIK